MSASPAASRPSTARRQVALGNGQQALLVEQLGVVLFQFHEQDSIISLDVTAIGRNQKQQHGVTFNVAQKTEAYTPPSAHFDDTGISAITND